MFPVRAHVRPTVSSPSLEQLEDRIVPAGLIGDLVSFGDSLSDVGNVSFNAGGWIPPSEFYFQGRYSGGPIWLDTLAEYLGEGPVVSSELGGLNYAYGGSTLFIPTALNPYQAFGAKTLGEQIGSYLDSHTPDANDLFTLWGGANDFFYAVNGSLTTLVEEVLTATTLEEVLAAQGTFLTAVGDLTPLSFGAAYAMEAAVVSLDEGGDQFVVANLPPLGQTPFFQDLLQFGIVNQAIVDAVDGWSATYNSVLKTRLDLLNDADTMIVQLDVAGIFSDLTALDNPLGLTNTTDAVGPYDAAGFLTGFTPGVDPNTYLFYDSVHPGSPAHQYIGLQAAAGVMDQLGISTVLVKTTDDVVDPLDGKISLREAVNLANTQEGEQTIFFALGNGNKTIKLESELTLTGDTNIVGPGANKLTISGQNQTRIFSVGANAEVTLAGMTLRNGWAEQGGAISNAGKLTVFGMDFLNNTASGENARGGAIYNTGELIVLLSTFKGNEAVGTVSAFGGAIASEGADSSVQVAFSQLTNNQARAPLAQGGAIFVGSGSSLSLLASTVTGNKAQGTAGGQGYGGGIYVANDALFIQFLSLIAGNNATFGKNVFLEA